MALDEDLASVPVHHKKDSGFLGAGKDLKLRVLQDILLPDLSVSGMGAVKGIVEAPHQGDLPVQSPVGVDARQLFLPFIFGDPIVVVKPESWGSPFSQRKIFLR